MMSCFYLITRSLSRNVLVVSGLLLFIIVVVQVKMLSLKNPNSSSITYFVKDNNRQENQKYRRKFNLMDEGSKPVKDCTLEYINVHKLAQDHPCVIEIIRSQFMKAPSSRDVPYQLTDANVYPNYKLVNDKQIKYVFKNKSGGFFVECGAFEGQMWSNTLDLEMHYNWTGLLIEGNPRNYKKLISRNRKAWTLPICLSLEPYPTKVLFVNPDNEADDRAGSSHIVETDGKGNKIYDQLWDKIEGQINKGTVSVQCFPFYSVLLASNRTSIDYFSLDVEGHEMRILKTIPWERVDIKSLRIEWLKIPSPGNNNLTGADVLTEYMEGEAGYRSFYESIYDLVFFRDYINKPPSAHVYQ